jgi:hypothetical protein
MESAKDQIAKLNLPLWQSHKVISAAPIRRVTRSTDDDSSFIIELENRETLYLTSLALAGKPLPQEEWYLVVYEGGYFSFSPPEVFERGSHRVRGAGEFPASQYAQSTMEFHGDPEILRATVIAFFRQGVTTTIHPLFFERVCCLLGQKFIEWNTPAHGGYQPPEGVNPKSCTIELTQMAAALRSLNAAVGAPTLEWDIGKGNCHEALVDHVIGLLNKG